MVKTILKKVVTTVVKTNYFCFLCLCPFILTGCWDTVNIEDRGFIVGTAIDIEESDKPSQPQFSVTNQMVLPGGMSYPSQGGGGDQKAFLNFTASSASIYKVDEEIVFRSSKQPFYEHLVVIIISEELAKKENLFVELLDTYIRDVDFRSGAKVVVSKGPAKELLNFTTPEDKLPTVHIDKILEQGSKQIGTITPKTTGDLEEYHLKHNSYVLPYVEVTDMVEQKNGAVFHGRQKKMVGLFNEDEMQGLELFVGKQQVKIIDFTYNDKVLASKIIRLSNKVKVDPSNLEDIKVHIEIEFEGTIKESNAGIDLTKESEIHKVQQAIADEVKKTIEKTIAKAQDEYGTDVFNIWQLMETEHYDTWVKVKDEWEEGEYYFKNVTFDINVVPQIYSIGTTNKTQ